MSTIIDYFPKGYRTKKAIKADVPYAESLLIPLIVFSFGSPAISKFRSYFEEDLQRPLSRSELNDFIINYIYRKEAQRLQNIQTEALVDKVKQLVIKEINEKNKAGI